MIKTINDDKIKSYNHNEHKIYHSIKSIMFREFIIYFKEKFNYKFQQL